MANSDTVHRTECVPLPQKKIYLEIVRLISIALVIFNHTESFAEPLNYAYCGEIGHLLSLGVSICTKVAVPLFFMISGALLLVREESLAELLRKRVFRFVVLIVLYQVLQHLYYFFIKHHEITTFSFIKDCIAGGVYGACASWFLYAYLSFLLLLPFLRYMVRNMPNKYFIYLFILQMILFAFIPGPKTGMSEWVSFCNRVYIYVLAGYFIEHRVNIQRIDVKQIFALIVGSCFSIVLSVLMCVVSLRVLGERCFSEQTMCFNNGLLIPCITIYVLIKKWSVFLKNPLLLGVITTLSSAVFTIMLSENILRDIATPLVHSYVEPSYSADVCIVVVACCLGFPLGILLKKIPYIQKLV